MTSVKSLVIAGVANNGPVGDILSFDLNNPNDAFDIYGYEQKDYFTLTPTTTTFTLSKTPINNAVNYYYLSNDDVVKIPLDNLSISGSVLTFSTPALITQINGWFSYAPVESVGSLTFNLKQVLNQSTITPPEDERIHLLRVAGSGSLFATGSIGPLSISTLYPTILYNNYKLEIVSGSILIYPDGGKVSQDVWTFDLLGSIHDLRSQINLSKIAHNFPFTVKINLEGILPATTLNSNIGVTSISGGLVTTPTPLEYASALDDLQLELCDIICLPGVAGRCFFPYTQVLFNNHVGFPFSFVCPTCQYSTDINSIKQDLYQSDRLYLVGGSI